MGEPDVLAELRRLAYRDHLTGLPNRASMQSRITSALERAEREGTALAVLFCDLDGVKLVNDTLGHARGDEVLTDAAGRLRALRGPNVTVARHGGDEFLLILEDLVRDRESVAESARGLAEEVVALLERPYSAGGATFELSASIGVALFPWHAKDGDELVARADSAMYEAKRSGRTRTAIFERPQQRSFRELEATLRVRRALAAGEFELHYQPVIEVADGGGLGGLEALIRWQDPDRGLVMPGDFLPFIEGTTLLEELGEWVYAEVCRQLEAWRGQGFTPRVSFNLPARQLLDDHFTELVIRRAQETGADLTRIAIEVTESAHVDLAEVLPRLERLRDAGLALSLDDFGTGYSSFARLRDMPFSLLKTDRSFMRGVPEDPTAVDFLQAIFQLGETLGLVVIVEGVETAEQRDALLAIGVRVAQGWLFDRALPPDEILARYGPCISGAHTSNTT